MICLPTSVEPVKQTLRTAGWVTKRCPTTDPFPGNTVKTCSGRPASSASSARRIAVSGVTSAGFSTTVFPAASAGANPQPAIGIGKFHGTMTPTTPSGSWNVMSTPPGTGICRAVQAFRRAGVEVEHVTYVSRLPPRVADGVARSSRPRGRRARRYGRRRPRRSGAGGAPDRRARPDATPSNAPLERSIAASVSSSVVGSTVRSAVPVAGLISCIRRLPRTRVPRHRSPPPRPAPMRPHDQSRSKPRISSQSVTAASNAANSTLALFA